MKSCSDLGKTHKISHTSETDTCLFCHKPLEEIRKDEEEVNVTDADDTRIDPGLSFESSKDFSGDNAKEKL